MVILFLCSKVKLFSHTLFNTTELETELATLLISDMVQQTIYENAHVALDQTEYQKRYDGLTQRFETAK